jgi:diguanylate cyclase (GGDEF)-like protein/PAS domain S-box-containing protein
MGKAGSGGGTKKQMRRLALPLVRRLGLVLLGYLILCGAVLGAHRFGIDAMVGAREQLSRELRAAEALLRHGRTRDEGDWAAYLQALAGALPSDAARAKLWKTDADPVALYGVFSSTRPALWLPAVPHRVLDLVTNVERVDQLAESWRQALGATDRIEVAAVALHRELIARRPTPARVERFADDLQRAIRQCHDADRVLIADLDRESASLGRAAERGILGLTLLALVTVLGIVFRSGMRLRRALSDVEHGVAQVSQGDFSGHVRFDATEGLDTLSSALNEMTRRLTEVREKASDNSRELSRAVHEMENILETIPDVICIVDLLGRLDLWNRNLETVTGLSANALKKKPVADLFVEADRAQIDEGIREGIRQGRFEVEGALRRANGTIASFHWSGAALEDEQNRVRGLTLSGRDITERKGLEDQLARQAFEDALTGLPNRALFMDRLAHALSRRDRRDHQVAVLFLDLNRFKTINDSLGHSLGDQLLVQVSRRLETCVRPEDTIARLGGDEFGVLLEDVESVPVPVSVAERIAAQLEAPFVLEGREVFVSTSVGIALSPSRRCHPEEVLRDADLAMYHAKGKGSSYEIFDGSVSAPSLERLDLELDLRSAVARQEFRVFYQPLVSLETGRITEVEALVRWQHPRRGLLSPSEFVALSEETGLIVPIGLWVLGEACGQARRWQTEHRRAVPVTVSVNLSGRQFQQPDLVQQIARVLDEARLDPALLTIEITESVVMHDAPATLVKLRVLKELGIRIAIDDFGTGYSSLSYLKRFPVDTLKIDRSFVQGIGHDPEDIAIVRAVVTVAKSLNLDVTAEGIDASHQVALLQSLGCDRAQGYYFAKPMERDAICDLLGRSAWLGPMGNPGLLKEAGMASPGVGIAAITPA